MVPALTLSNGVKQPVFGLGTFLAPSKEVVNAVKVALKTGYRLIDTAALYENEDAVGQALSESIANGVVKREEVFITTKLFANNLHPQRQEAAIRESLKKLRLDYVDLYLAHVPTATNADGTAPDTSVTVEDIWGGLEGLYAKKLTRAIGVCNFSLEQIERVQKIAKVPIQNHQFELHLYFQQKALREQAKKYNITVTAYAPLGSPGRKDFKMPDGSKVDWPQGNSPLEDQVANRLAKKYGKSAAQILLRHLIQNGIAVIPKSTNDSRIEGNFDIWDFELSNDEVAELNNAPQGNRLFDMPFQIGHPEDSFKNERPA